MIAIRTPRAWQRMLSGRRLDLLDPSPLDIEIADIAHGLARVARWNGQTHGSHVFSVAQHSLLVEAIGTDLAAAITPSMQLELLLHDAPEYVIGDIISPLKSAIGNDYKIVERRLLAAIRVRFGLDRPPATLVQLVKRADRIAAHFEATRLAGFSVEEGERIFGRPPTLPASLAAEFDRLLTPAPTDEAQRQYRARFDDLIGHLAESGNDPANQPGR